MQVIDLFAGGGGASEGIRMALGKGPDLAINHDPLAIAMHAANHPRTIHLTEDLFKVEPQKPRRGVVDLLWASPDCTHHSRAKGGKPRESGRRLLAWVVVEWARDVHPRCIILENVPEFADWGPLDSDGQPIAAQRGETFREFCAALSLAGYRVEYRTLNAADYGTPTCRKRLFLIARSDGLPIAWPEPTHGPGRIPYRAAAECIDWSIPIRSIFGRERPLAEATQRRIAEGVRRFVLTNPRPFLITTANGERQGQTPRVRDLSRPLGTVCATGSQGAVVAAWLAKHNGSGETWNAAIGSALTDPVHTITGTDSKALATVELARGPGARAHQVAAFLTKFYGAAVGQNQDLRDPLHTIRTGDCFGLVTVDLNGEPWVVADIGMRMLQPRELAFAQGFGPDYILTGTKRQQVARIGNSVCPPVAEALVRAQFGEPARVAA